jgi:two-component system, NarL family, sensor histidine kinase DesK
MKSEELEERVSGAHGTPGQLHQLPVWAQYIWLIYVLFVFSPALSSGHDLTWLWPTVISVVVFLYLYITLLRRFRDTAIPGPRALPKLWALAGLGYILALWNDSANTYIIYCVAVTPFISTNIKTVGLLMIAVLGLYGLELLVIGMRPVTYGITCIVSIAAGVSNYMLVENRRKNAMLRLSREEVHRLGRIAERERIGRDLHDLLGHTLSLIAIKSELAAKLIDRDRAAATREVTEVTKIARDALRQVRTAVAGIRAAALEHEIDSAKTLLQTAGVSLSFEREGGMLPPEIETVLAMIVREAATNIQRHSGAENARVEVNTETGVGVLLTISDDGRGGITLRGSGLSGIQERVGSLGGTLEIDSPRGEGTTLRVRLPLLTQGADGPASTAVGVSGDGSGSKALQAVRT